MLDIRVKVNPNKFIADNLEKLEKYHAEIGVYGGKEPNGSDLVMIATVHEFGNNVNPARSFLRYPLQFKKDKIQKAYKKLLIKYLDKSNGWNDILKGLCIVALDVVNDAFETGGFGSWRVLTAQTIIRKNGGTAILIDTGHLRRSIITKVVANKES